jgi:hypothetical protein
MGMTKALRQPENFRSAFDFTPTGRRNEAMASVPQITIVNHPTSPAHKIIKVITRGRVYAVTSAEPFPTVEEVRELWRTERRVLRPYDENTGCYLGGR